MDARRREAEQHVARRDPVAGQLLPALDRADAEPCKVVIARGVHPRHLGGLAADQRATGDPAPLGDARDDAFGNLRIELPGGEVIEEEQRLGALNDQIVGAHRDEIDTDPLVPIMLDRELDLGADAVVGGDQQRVGIARRAWIEEAAEAAELGIGAGPRGRPRERRDPLDQRVARRDRHSGLSIVV